MDEGVVIDGVFKISSQLQVLKIYTAVCRRRPWVPNGLNN